jgi:integrase
LTSRFLDAASKAPRAVRSLCLTLHYTGCRVSEALALTVRRMDLSGKVIVFETLKKRRQGVYKAVPVPGDMLGTLDMVHGLREAQKRPQALDAPLWPWTRTHAWRVVRCGFRANPATDSTGNLPPIPRES